ncbi:MAG: mechanosensitive ion channel [Lachnospiraceae bacterium]|nr:mechanosensitive ion channel [Lachnospiraceae bacterium]
MSGLTELLCRETSLQVNWGESIGNSVSKLWDNFWPGALAFAGKLVIVLIIWFVGKRLMSGLLRLIARGFEKAHVDAGVSGFIGSILKVILYFVLIMLIANVIGIATTSVVALVGSVGLTIGLALQGSLANFAGGVLLLLLKPFRVGDYVVAQGLEGSVTKVDLFYTTIVTVDNRTVVLPNGTLSNGSIINVTHEPERRLDLVIPIGYGDDIRRAKGLLQRIVDRHAEQIFPERGVTICVGELGDSAIEINFRVWVKREDYWTLRAELLEEIKYTFDENHISIPFQQMDVHLVKGE